MTGTIGRYLQGHVSPIEIDLLKERNIYDWFSKNRNLTDDTQLIHLAGMVGPKSVAQEPIISEKINVSATVSLAESFLNNGGGRFIYVSSSHVYKWKESPISEVDELLPLTLYAAQKLQAEIELGELFRNYPQKLLILRVFSVLDFDCKSHTLGGRVAGAIKFKNQLSVENANHVRDFLTPRNVAEVLIEILSLKSLSGVFNVCTKRPLSVRDAVLEMIGQVPDFQETIEFVDSLHPTIIVGENAKILEFMPNLMHKLHWTPSVLL